MVEKRTDWVISSFTDGGKEAKINCFFLCDKYLGPTESPCRLHTASAFGVSRRLVHLFALTVFPFVFQCDRDLSSFCSSPSISRHHHIPPASVSSSIFFSSSNNLYGTAYAASLSHKQRRRPWIITSRCPSFNRVRRHHIFNHLPLSWSVSSSDTSLRLHFLVFVFFFSFFFFSPLFSLSLLARNRLPTLARQSAIRF